MVRAEAKSKYPEMVGKLKDFNNTIEGAESYESFRDRVGNVMSDVAVRNHVVVAVVTHGGVIKAILRGIKYSADYSIEDCAVAELEVGGGKVRVVRLVGIEPKN